MRFTTEMLEKEKIRSKNRGDSAQPPTSLHELHDKLIDLEKEMKVRPLSFVFLVGITGVARGEAETQAACKKSKRSQKNQIVKCAVKDAHA